MRVARRIDENNAILVVQTRIALERDRQITPVGEIQPGCPVRQQIDWITGPDGQAAIAAYRIGNDQLFFPNAR